MLQAQWIEIPVKDITRALAFYRNLFGLSEIEISDDGTRKTAILSAGDAAVGISLNQTKDFEPHSDGTLASLKVDMETFDKLDSVESLGGAIHTARMPLGGGYYFASFLDTEGNQVGMSASEAGPV